MAKSALVIGAKRTSLPGFSDQEIAVNNDLQLINNLLINNNWPEGHIRIIQNDNELIKANVLIELSQLAQSAKPGDQILLYFSGHGFEHIFKETTAQSLVLYDTYIFDYEIRKIFRKASPASMLIALFDCCHSGTIIDFSPKINFPATIYMGACKDSEKATSYPGGSLFTSTIYNIKQQVPQISYSELKNQLASNIHEPEPVFTEYEVSKTFLDETIAFN
jgi:hypothetical protein